MNIWVYSIFYNSIELVPFYLRHYERMAEKIVVWDDASTDGTRELLKAHPKVELHDWPYNDGINEDRFLEHVYSEYPKSKSSWVIWVDPDEFIYHRDWWAILAAEFLIGTEVIQTVGFNMAAPEFPKDDGKSQIWELVKTGAPAPVYSKPVIFRPTVKVRWIRGKHMLENCNPKVSSDARLKLLHYRYLGYTYTKLRNAKNYERCGLESGDKGAAWSCSPNYHGEHSADWAGTDLLKAAVNVLI